MPNADSTHPSLPAIVAPVVRRLIVSDVARSVAFYRQVLGFTSVAVREAFDFPAVAEVVSGPARIQLGIRRGAAERSDRASPRVVFLETEDVVAMHAGLRARGGQPSELEKVNWIKMRVFEIRDPDGHTLWFGESFHQPNPSRPRPLFREALPELPLDDVAAGVEYYRDVLGFHINYQQDDLGVMDRDEVTLLLIARAEQNRGTGSAYLYVGDVDALYEELVAKGAKVDGRPVSQPWGLREFRVLDLEGNRISFGQPFE